MVEVCYFVYIYIYIYTYIPISDCHILLYINTYSADELDSPKAETKTILLD